MAIEDFTTYTEDDPNSRITVTATKVSWAGLLNNEEGYVYADKGVNYYSGDFEFQFTIRSISSGVPGSVGSNQPTFWSLANLVDSYNDIYVANGDYLILLVGWSTGVWPYLVLQECSGGTLYGDSPVTFQISVDTEYYITIKRDESVGDFGTLYCYVYTNFARTNLVHTFTITLHSSKKDFRYLYALQSRNTGSAWQHTGYTKDLEVTLSSNPTVTTEPLTDITETTATGNGTIVDMGFSSVTEHGHVWATSIDPTTGGSETTLGSGSLGVFTSSITGLLDGQKYYVRAYATNSEGTSYGANISFTAGVPSTQLIRGNITVTGEFLAYVDEAGKRRKILGDEY